MGKKPIEICLEVLNEGANVGSLNKPLITFIPKKKHENNLKDFRPTSLCNVIYKIISKVLANRLKRVMNSVISPTQSAFVIGRLITDNAIIGFEYIHALNNKRSGRDKMVALKLDMIKAYDRIE